MYSQRQLSVTYLPTIYSGLHTYRTLWIVCAGKSAEVYRSCSSASWHPTPIKVYNARQRIRSMLVWRLNYTYNIMCYAHCFLAQETKLVEKGKNAIHGSFSRITRRARGRAVTNRGICMNATLPIPGPAVLSSETGGGGLLLSKWNSSHRSTRSTILHSLHKENVQLVLASS